MVNLATVARVVFPALNVAELLLAVFAVSLGAAKRAALLIRLVYWGVSESVFRQDRAMETDHTKDKGSSVRNVVSLVGLSVGPTIWVLLVRGFGRETPSELSVLDTLALSSMVFATILRWISMALLGKRFSVTLKVQEGHTVVDTGPYAVVRHPGYTSNLLLFTGNALVMFEGSLLGALGVVGVFAWVWGARVKAEEEMLVREVKGYREYRQKVKSMFLPGIW